MDDVWTDWQTDGWTSAHGHRWSHTFVRTTAFVPRRRSRSWSAAPIGQEERWQGWHLPCFWLVERCEASHLPRLLLAAALRGSFSPEQYGREESNNITNMPSAPSQFCQDKRMFINQWQIQYCEIITLLWSLYFGESLKRSINVSPMTKKSFRRLSWTLFFGLVATDGYVVSRKFFSPRQSSVFGVKSIFVMMYLGKQDSMVQTSVSLDQKSDKIIGASWPREHPDYKSEEKKRSYRIYYLPLRHQLWQLRTNVYCIVYNLIRENQAFR